MRLRPYQQAAVNAVFNEWYQENHSRTLAILPTGCHAIGQKLLLADGSVKAVENISYTDRLMGADGTPRRILLRHTGNDTLFRIIPIKGEPFTVTGNHKLTLIRTGESSTLSFPCRNKKGELIDVTVDEWMTWSKYRKHIHKLVRCSVVRQFDVETVELPIDSYFLGCLLGDGSLSSTISITTPDPEIVEVINEQAQKYGLNIRTEPAGKATTYIFSSNWKRKDLTMQLNQLGLRHTKSNNKFVPSIYKTASFNERLEIIAGLLDTDGSGTGNGFDFISKSKQLVDDLVFMCRSVGLAAYCKDCQKGYGTDFFATYWRVSISGDCSIIPNRVQRKKQRPRQQKKNVLVTGFSVERCASGDFIGFTVDGDNRYLLDDFTITHNCGKTVIFSEITKREVREKQHKVLILAHREELLLQAQDKLFKTTGLYAELEKGKNSTLDSNTPVVIGSIQTLCRTRRLNQFTPDTFDCIIIDEAHHCLSESYQRVLWYFKNAHVLGVTATPDRGDKKELAEYFNSTAYQYNLLDAIKDGYLAPIKLLKLQVSINLNNVHIKGGDYDENDLGESIRPYLYDIASKLKANCFGRKIAVFLPLISISQEFAEIMNKMGFSAVEVNGSSTDRQEKLQAFEQGQYNVITNAMLLCEGWDCPSVDCIVVLRPTKIRALYCLDEDTEILTDQGWVQDAKIGDMVAAYNKNTGEIVYTPVIEKVRRPLEQDEYFCSIKSPTLDIRVTNKHRMLYDNKNRLGWKFTTAEQLASLKSGAYIPVSGNIKTKGIPLTDDEIKFLTWFMTDGTLNQANGVIQISQGEHQPWLEDIASCISACNMKYGRRSSWRKTSFNQTSKNVTFYISYGQPRGTDKDKRGWAYLEKYVDKDIPDSFFEMNDHQFDIMLKIAHLADGAKNIYSVVEGNSYHISKGNKRFIERLQILAITHGYKANVAVSHQNKSPLYTLHVKKKTYAVCGSAYDNRPTWIKEPHTQENCWCVQNAYGTLITRRNGKVSIVGNCQMVGRGLRLSPETSKKDCQLVDFMWLSERHDLCSASCLVCETDEQSRILQEMMSETAEIDLMTAAQEANKKLLEEEDKEPKEKGSTEDTIRQNLIKNLNILNVGQDSMIDVVNHEDIYKWEQEPASEKQIQMLEKNGFKLTNVSKGMASKIISIIVERAKNGLATFKQVKTLKSHGLKNPEKWSMDEASRCISYLVANRWYIEPDKLEQINEVMTRRYA